MSGLLIGPVVVLNYTAENLPVVAQKVHDGMNNNGLFGTPSIPMSQLAADIAAYRPRSRGPASSRPRRRSPSSGSSRRTSSTSATTCRSSWSSRRASRTP